jgi:hypothetical protein
MSKERELLRKVMETGMLDRALTTEVGQMLAQPETKQEPVAWQLVANFITDGDILQYTYSKPRAELYEHYRVTPLYTSPPTRKPLSEQEISDLWDKTSNTKTIVKGKDMTLWDYILMFARTIEQHGIGS